MKHRPRAEVIDVGLKWDAGGPCPSSSGAPGAQSCSAMNRLLRARGSTSYEIRFKDCASVRMGHPNHIVHDSPWLEEHRQMNAVHDYHSDATWERLHHRFVAFHDEVVEALAKTSRPDG